MSAAVGSAAVNVFEGYDRAYLQVPTFASATDLDVYASADGGTTYYQLRHMAIASASSQTPTFIVASSAMANGAMVPIPPGFANYRFKATDSNPSGAIAFTLLCST
jgi:hypothetical protein